jgi:hypothetical protein
MQYESFILNGLMRVGEAKGVIAFSGISYEFKKQDLTRPDPDLLSLT